MAEIQSNISGVFRHNSYLVRRKIFTLFGAEFHIYDPSGAVAFYSKQKAFKLKEDIRVYTGEDMRTEVLAIHARNVIDISATYDVIDPASNIKVGALRRKGIKSMLRDEWLILDREDVEIGVIREDRMLLAVIRRFLSNLVPQKYHGYVDGRLACVFSQNFNPFVTKIHLDYSMDTRSLLDRRLGIAAAILLCAIEGKQS
ncbi:MAG: hypothetical protein WC481_06085 [Candidatus Omnitrophota bacterium]